MKMTEHQKYERWSERKNEIEEAIYLDLVRSWHKKSNYVNKELYEESNGSTEIVKIRHMDEKITIVQITLFISNILMTVCTQSMAEHMKI